MRGRLRAGTALGLAALAALLAAPAGADSGGAFSVLVPHGSYYSLHIDRAGVHMGVAASLVPADEPVPTSGTPKSCLGAGDGRSYYLVKSLHVAVGETGMCAITDHSDRIDDVRLVAAGSVVLRIFSNDDPGRFELICTPVGSYHNGDAVVCRVTYNDDFWAFSEWIAWFGTGQRSAAYARIL